MDDLREAGTPPNDPETHPEGPLTSGDSVVPPTSADLKPEYAKSIDFLKWWRPEGPWSLVAIEPDHRQNIQGASFTKDQLPAMRAWLEEHGKAQNLYFCVNPLTSLLQKKPLRTDVLEMAWLHLDVDPKPGLNLDTERTRILELLTKHEPTPSCIIDSGGGYQAFWRLETPVPIGGSLDRAREACTWNLQLESEYWNEGADACHNIDRIMRLPGTINRPDAKKREKGRIPRVASVVWAKDFSYPISKFLACPQVASPSETVSGERVEVNVSGNVRRTENLDLLPVSPLVRSVIAEGCDPDNPTRWSDRSDPLFWVCCEMVRAEVDDETIYGIITDPEWGISASVLDKGSQVQRYACRQIARAREATKDRTTKLVLCKNDPMAIAKAFRSRVMPTLRRHAEDWLQYEGAAYAEVEQDTVRAKLYAFLGSVLQPSGKDGVPPVPFIPTAAIVTNVIDALRADAHVEARAFEPPCWLGEPLRPADEIIACANGLLHLPTRDLLPLTPEFFTRNALDINFDASAAEPTRWLQFLSDVWQHDTESIETLQEIFGYLLSADTSQQKIFMVVGPPRSGKGTIGRILEQLVGKSNSCSPSSSSFSQQFGLQDLIGKQLILASDIRVSQFGDRSAVVENLLRISGEDSVTVNRKFKGGWTGRLPGRFVIMSNEIPSLEDSSGALGNRLVILKMTRSFLGSEDHGLDSALTKELPGILLWAVEGWDRLRERGFFRSPAASAESAKLFHEMASPHATFLNEKCVLSGSVPKAEMFKAWTSWCEAQGLKPGTLATFAKGLMSVVPTITTSRTSGPVRVTTFEGVSLHPPPF